MSRCWIKFDVSFLFLLIVDADDFHIINILARFTENERVYLPLKNRNQNYDII